jgi:hypothetical protein
LSGRAQIWGCESSLECERENNKSQWFERVKPSQKSHNTYSKLPHYDFEKELAAVPKKPIEDYRQQALEYVDEVIEARDSVRPDSPQTAFELPNGIGRSARRRGCGRGNSHMMRSGMPAARIADMCLIAWQCYSRTTMLKQPPSRRIMQMRSERRI